MNNDIVESKEAGSILVNKERIFIRIRSKITLPIALIILILLALIIVTVGFSLYWNDSNRKYDIARGDKESRNQALVVEDGTTDRTSPVDAASIKHKKEFLDQESKALNQMSNFKPDDISDENLQLSVPDQPSF